MKRSLAARIFAIVGLILIGLMLIATLLVGLIDFKGRDKVFMAMVFIDIVVPVFLWLFLVILKKKSHVLNYEANVEGLDIPDADDLETKNEEGN